MYAEKERPECVLCYSVTGDVNPGSQGESLLNLPLCLLYRLAITLISDEVARIRDEADLAVTVLPQCQIPVDAVQRQRYRQQAYRDRRMNSQNYQIEDDEKDEQPERCHLVRGPDDMRARSC